MNKATQVVNVTLAAENGMLASNVRSTGLSFLGMGSVTWSMAC